MVRRADLVIKTATWCKFNWPSKDIPVITSQCYSMRCTSRFALVLPSNPYSSINNHLKNKMNLNYYYY